jgi:hypothetical protein
MNLIPYTNKQSSQEAQMANDQHSSGHGTIHKAAYGSEWQLLPTAVE